jgi:hypothetical protein
MLKILAASIIFMTACSYLGGGSSTETNLSGQDDNSFYCKSGIPHFLPDGSYVCNPAPVWPPAHTGSRSTPANCSISNGRYNIAWGQHGQLIVPQPVLTDGIDFNDMVVALKSPANFTTDIGSSYQAQWESVGLVELWDDSGRIFNFTVSCLDDATIVGTYIFDLPYLAADGNQTPTWTFAGTRAQ